MPSFFSNMLFVMAKKVKKLEEEEKGWNVEPPCRRLFTAAELSFSSFLRFRLAFDYRRFSSRWPAMPCLAFFITIFFITHQQ